MKTIFLSFTLLVAISTQAQLPTAAPKAAGFDPARVEVLHATTLLGMTLDADGKVGKWLY